MSLATPPTLVSLFAGAGGLDLGLEAAGFRTLLANEVEHHACQTLRDNKLLPTLTEDEFDHWFARQLQQRCYKSVSSDAAARLKLRIANDRTAHSWLRHSEVIQTDVRLLTGKDVEGITGVPRGQLSLIAGGPPCQPFSRSGKRETMSVADGRLFLEFVRLVNELQPRFFLFENVKGLILSKTDVVQWRCLDCLRVSLAEFDVRERWLAGENAVSVCACGSTNGAFNVSRLSDGSLQIILAEFERIGYNCHWRVLNAADYGVPQLRERLFIIGSRDNERIQWPRPTHSAKALKGSQSPLFAGDASSVTASWRTMWDCLWHKGHPVFGSLDPEVARLWVKNVVRPHDEPVTWTLDRPSPTVGAHQAAKLAIAPFGVPEEQLLRQQWHTLGRRQGDMPPVSVVHEYLSDEELLRLQTFPPQWYLFGTRMERARQIGNAVPVLLARAVGSALLGAKHGATDIDDELTGAFHDG